MRKNKFNNVAGLTLIEIMLGVVISSIMMAAMYTTYNVVNNSYSQVVDRAKISRSGRDIVGMIMRDIRLAGFKYYYGIHKKMKTIEKMEIHTYQGKIILSFKE